MAVDHNNPQSRDEEILIATIDGTEYNKLPQSRMEELLLELKEVIEEGGGGGGTSDYENLSNQPQVNGETLIGDKSGADLGLVDAEEGKGLSTNDYDDTEKAAVAAATSAISAMQDGSDIDSFGDVEVALLDKADISDLGTAAAKDSTNAVTSGSTDLVESGAVKDAIDTAVAAAYHHAGTKTVAQLTHDLLVAANEGNVYNITDSGTTTSDFIEGIGKQIDAGDNVGICKVGDVYMFDLLSGLEDTSIFVQKSQTAGLLKNDGTVNDEIEGDVATLKSGLTNYEATTNAALAVPENTGKNVLPYPFSETTKTVNGVTFTDNGNGTISTSGTATKRTVFYIQNANANLHIPAGIYTVSKSYQNTYTVLNVDGYNGNTWVKTLAKSSSTDDVTITVDYDRYDRIIMYLEIGVNINTDNLIFKPMIRPATITDPTFAPYIPSVESRIEAVESVVTDSVYKVGDTINFNSGNGITVSGFLQKTVNSISTLYAIIPIDKPVIASNYTITISDCYVNYSGSSSIQRTVDSVSYSGKQIGSLLVGIDVSEINIPVNSAITITLFGIITFTAS